MKNKHPKPLIEKDIRSNRDPIAYSLKNFRSTKFKHKNEKRGGAKNKQREILNEIL